MKNEHLRPGERAQDLTRTEEEEEEEGESSHFHKPSAASGLRVWRGQQEGTPLAPGRQQVPSDPLLAPLPPAAATPEPWGYTGSVEPRSCPAGRVGPDRPRSPAGATRAKHRPRDVLGLGDLRTPGCRGAPPASRGPALAGGKERREVAVEFKR